MIQEVNLGKNIQMKSQALFIDRKEIDISNIEHKKIYQAFTSNWWRERLVWILIFYGK